MKQINKTKSLAIAVQSSLEKAERSSKSCSQFLELQAKQRNHPRSLTAIESTLKDVELDRP